MNVYDLIVIGGGPAGYNSAERAAKAGMTVLLFEKNELGGVCLNEGCVPSKTLLNSAKIYNYVKHSESYGVEVENKGFVSQNAVIERKNKVVKRLVTGVRSKLKNAGVTVIKSAAHVKGKVSDGFCVTSDGEDYLSKKLLIASGSTPFVPEIKGLAEGLESGFVLTNREILNLTEIPERLAIIGGGVIGLEMADYYASVGSKVIVAEALDKIAGQTDIKVSAVLQKALEKKGVEFRLSAKVKSVGEGCLRCENADGGFIIEADKILLSVGRRAATEGLGLENIGVEILRGSVVTDDKMRTNVQNVYAVGDINGKSMLAHTAYREGEVAVNDMLDIDDKMDYKAIPSVIYTTPEVASVGETLESAEAKGINAREVNISLMYSGRYIAENTDYTGICRLVYDADKHTLIGAHIVGNYASEYIVAVANLIDLEVEIDRVKKLVFPHPTVCEVIREAVFEIE